MSSVGIRLANERDCESVTLVLSEAFLEFQSLYTREAFAATVISPYEARRRMQEGPLWLAEYEGKVVGTAALLIKDKDAYLRGMAVLPGMQGLKIGLSLLREAEQFARSEQCRRLYLRTTPYLDKAIRLYEQFGFARLGREQEDFFGTPSFLMEKKFEE